MSDTVISVEGLGKKYRIGAARERYVALRDVLTRSAVGVGRRLLRREAKRPAYEDFWALRDVSFDVKPGECVGIIGRNGAGKSTLLKLLSRITEPTAGRFRIRGRLASLLEVGTGFHPELTGRENVYLNGAILGLTRREIDRKFDEIVAFAEIDQFLDTPVKYYSSGMYMRLAFAVAAHLEAEILVVDEVLAVGDTAFQKKCLGKMNQVARGGKTVLFVSHNLSALTALCPKAVLLRQGRISSHGPVLDVVHSYLSQDAQPAATSIDMRSHPARSRHRESLIQSVRLLNAINPLIAAFAPRSPLTIQLRVKSPIPIQHPRYAIAIEDAMGRRLMTAASYFQSRDLSSLVGEATVECVIPSPNLGPGKYMLSLSVSTRFAGLLDSVDHALWFEISEGNCYETSESHSPIYGPVLVDSSWTTKDVVGSTGSDQAANQ